MSRYTLHPMIGMSLREQEDWFNERIPGVYDIDTLVYPMIKGHTLKNPHNNVIQFKPRDEET